MKEGTARHYAVKHGLKWQQFLTPEEKATIQRLWASENPFDREKWRYFSHLYRKRAKDRMIGYAELQIKEET
jgi:hypothetical protein